MTGDCILYQPIGILLYWATGLFLIGDGEWTSESQDCNMY